MDFCIEAKALCVLISLPGDSHVSSPLDSGFLIPSNLWAQVPDSLSVDSVVGAPDSTVVYVLDPLTVRGRIDDLSGLAVSASEGYVGYRDFLLRPLAREGELLETVPGMILTQHSGSGKSNQMFVRGFSLDHGTDFSTQVEGMPVNIRSHAHGQGYTDMNFLVPELVQDIDYSLGGYYAEIGDSEARVERS